MLAWRGMAMCTERKQQTRFSELVHTNTEQTRVSKLVHTNTDTKQVLFTTVINVDLPNCQVL